MAAVNLIKLSLTAIKREIMIFARMPTYVYFPNTHTHKERGRKRADVKHKRVIGS